MRSEKIRENIKIFQRHPAQLSIKEKQNKNVNKSCGKCLETRRDTEQVYWQRVNACMMPRQLRWGTEQACWQRSNVG